MTSARNLELDHSQLREKIGTLYAAVTKIFPGKEELSDVALSALFCSGHVLLEDVPGVGKTTFIKAIAQMMDLEVSRVQFTSDLLPSDILGVEIFNTAYNEFQFHKGPIFSNILIADELNRASPRTQSALLEAMGEGMVTIDRKSHSLTQPFIVFASQNPSEQRGTYQIPESQLDRFAAKVKLGYPKSAHEKEILRNSYSNPLIAFPKNLIQRSELCEIQEQVERVFVSDSTLDYIAKVVDQSRNSGLLRQGISTRGAVSWVRMGKAFAFLKGRDYLTPDDLMGLAVVCLSHRVVTHPGKDEVEGIREVLDSIEVS